MFKNFALFGTVITAAILPFAEVSPESVSGWEKLGIVGILLAAIGFLIFERRVAMKELTTEVSKLTDEIKELKTWIRVLAKFEKTKSSFQLSSISHDEIESARAELEEKK